MIYRFEGFMLDASTRRLLRQVQPLKVPKRVFDCLLFLIEHRDRAVSRDELIRNVWGRDTVTDNQLAQTILLARKLIGDEGNEQRFIRTVQGVGYHWVADVEQQITTLLEPSNETQARVVAESAANEDALLDTAPLPTIKVTESIQTNRFSKRWIISGLVVLFTMTVIVHYWKQRQPIGKPTVVSNQQASSPLATLEEALWRGKYEEVRQGLATLPAALAESPEAQLLEIRLDIARGRFDRATEKLVELQNGAKTVTGPIWLAKLLATQSFLNGSAGRPGQQVLAPAQLAVKILEATGSSVPPSAMGEALSARGYGLMKVNMLESAETDLVRARALQIKGGDVHGASDSADSLARIQMRTGRLAEALVLMNQTASFYQQSGAPVQEIYARNAATKIQVELLRWNDALTSSSRSMQLLHEVPDSERRTRVVQLRALVLTGMGRLREAASLIEEGQAMNDERYSTIIPATFHLASGQLGLALKEAELAEAFTRYGTNDTLNLESKEGALLLWMIAAQDLAANGRPMPMPSPGQLSALQQPKSSIGHIALGRWLWSQDKLSDAETQFRMALAQSRQMGHLSRMLSASEPLIELLLKRGDAKGAEQVLSELQGYDPERIDQDYRASLLEMRISLALKQKPDIASAYKKATGLAGERTFPKTMSVEYKKSMLLAGHQ